MEDWLRELEGRTQDLEQQVQRLEKRTAPGVELYEAMVPYGIDRFAPMMLRQFARQAIDDENGVKRRAWHQRWWGRLVIVLTLAIQLAELYFIARQSIKGG